MRYRQVILLTILSMFLLSCGTTKRATHKRIYAEIKEAEQTDNIEKLMYIYASYPEYEEYLSNYLTKVHNFDKHPYQDLLNYDRIASEYGLPQLIEDFSYIRFVREQRIEDSISSLNLKELGVYYRNHNDEQQYLDSLFAIRIYPIIDESDYITLRQVHNSFQGTPLGDYSDQYYTPLREELITIVLDNMNEYFNDEKNILNAVENQTIDELDQYTQGVVDEIVQYCLNNKLPWIKSNVNEQADVIVSNFYNKQFAEKNVISNIDNFVTETRYSREKYLSELLQGVDVDTDLGVPVPSNCIRISLTPGVDYNAFMNLRNAQRKIDWFGMGLTAASFVIAWPAGILVDVADIAYSTYSDKAKEDAIIQEFKNFIPSVYSHLMDNTVREIQVLFNTIGVELNRTQQYMINYVEKNF